MELKIGVVGLGNCGGQIAALAKEEGFSAVAINVSGDDVKTLEDKVSSIIIGNQMGSGKNREMGKKYGKESIMKILQKDSFRKVIDDSQLVFVCYSMGGGTGAALGPMMTAMLKAKFSDEDPASRKRFINIAVLPDIGESLQAQENALATFRELVSYESCYGIYDNNKYSGKGSLADMMKTVNREIVEDFKVIRGDYNLTSEYTQIDAMDMLNTMSFNGMFRICTIVGFNTKDLDNKTIEQLLIDNMNNHSAGCEIERDKTVGCIAVIANVREDVAAHVVMNMPDIHALVGEANADYSHYYAIKDDETDNFLKNRVHVILTGLSVPDDRLAKIRQRIDEARANTKKVKQSTVLSEFTDAENRVEQATQEKKLDADSVLDMF